MFEFVTNLASYELDKALVDYTAAGGQGKTTFDQNDAIALMQEKYEIVKSMFYGFDYKKFFDLKPSERISFVRSAMDHILKEKDKKERFVREATVLLRTFSLAVPSQESMSIKSDVGLFQAIKSSLVKTTETGKVIQQNQFDTAIKQILSKAVISDRIIDIFEAAGKEKPDISILSEKFLMEVKNMPQKNLAFEALKKLLNDEIKIIKKRNIIQGKSFMDMLEKTIKKYTNRSVEAAQIIDELLEIARSIRNEKTRGKQKNMDDNELAFYDALEVNDSAVKILGDEILRTVALELTQMIRKNVRIDWTQKESVRAKLRLEVKKILKKHGYPPDKAENAKKRILEQAEEIARHWAEK